MISVVVANDSIEQNSQLCEFLTKDNEIKIVSRTFDGESTLKNYLNIRPDVLILDLKMPKKNGIEIINELSNIFDEKDKCNIIVISAYYDYMAKLCNVSQVYRIFSKPYNIDELIQAVKEIGNNNISVSQKAIRDLLISFKMNPYSKGTLYLIDAIQVSISRPELLNNITDLYKIIGMKNNLKLDKIQRSIRGSVDNMNNHIPTSLLCSFFKVTKTERISPKYFITVVVDYFIYKNV